MTLWYRAPEVLLGTTYATPVDIWSCGCIFAELYRRSPLFPGKYETDQLAKIFQVVGTPPLSAWPEDSPVLRNNFVNNLPRNLQDLVPEIDPLALDLLEVSSLLSVGKQINRNVPLIRKCWCSTPSLGSPLSQPWHILTSVTTAQVLMTSPPPPTRIPTSPGPPCRTCRTPPSTPAKIHPQYRKPTTA